MYKSCSRCGKIHDSNYKCYANDIHRNRMERKLRSQYSWTKKSEEIRERANYLCEVCKDKGIINYTDIEVHHIVKVSDDASKLLDNYNLICLCQEHHKAADKNQIDKDYLINLANRRENGSGGEAHQSDGQSVGWSQPK